MTTQTASTEIEGFAPGPYEVFDDDELNGCPFIPIYAADGTCVAQVPADYDDNDLPVIGERERAAARLFSAGPDMLEALMALDAYWTEAFPNGPDGDCLVMGGLGQLSDECKALWRAIRAAIAKAQPRPRKITGRSALRVDDMSRKD